MDLVVVSLEGKFGRCHQCGMQINPSYPWHFTSKKCSIGVERKQQREAAVTSAPALRQQFLVHGDVLEQVEVFKYLGRLLAQDDNDIQAIHAQLRKAWATWARVGQVLRSKNASPCVAAKFYKAVVQAMLLYGSKTWVLSSTALARLEGFHICAAYRMTKKNKPRRGPAHRWVYPKSEDVLEECRLKTIPEYIDVRQQTIVEYVATCPILDDSVQGEQKRRAIPHRWWWEQKMDLDGADATGSDK
jgi:hypothetical protein